MWKAPRLRDWWERYRHIALPSAFFIGVIYYEELFLKQFCFGEIYPRGVVFTLLFTIPLGAMLGLLCAGVPRRVGRWLLPGCTALISLWIGSQTVYYHLFKTFLTIFSLTKMAMVAGEFGDMAVSQVFVNWFPILMLTVPVILAWRLRDRLLPEDRGGTGRRRLRWTLWAAAVYCATVLVVLCSDGGVISLRYIYLQAAAPELEVQYFGMFTQTTLEVRRVLFGIDPDEEGPQEGDASLPAQDASSDAERYGVNVMDIDFHALEEQTDDQELQEMHRYFSQVTPTAKNEWTGRFAGKNLIWIVAEGFCTLAMDPERTPTLWKLSHEGIVCSHFYTPLWGVSTSDGEYATTTGLIPKSGVWSYSQSAENYMPFGFGNLFGALGYRTLAFHDHTYTYYDRDKSFPNMGYEYYGVGNGLELTETWPESDREMMDETVSWYVDDPPFMVYYLTVSGHLNYTFEENAMSRRHQAQVADLPYSEGPRAYLACQMELEDAMNSLLTQLDEAGELEDTVIVLSGDHYPYGLTDEEYSELLGHPVDTTFEIFQNTLILWSADVEEPVQVDKYCSSLDVMPTLANLFGLEYDSRLLAGRDILSDTPGLVIFADYSFLTDEGAYDSGTDTFTAWDGSQADPEMVESLLTEVQNRVAYSALILDRDYYRVALNGPPRKEQELSLPGLWQEITGARPES